MSELQHHRDALLRELEGLEAELHRLRAALGGEAARQLRDQLAVVEAEVASLLEDATAAEAELDARLRARRGEPPPEHQQSHEGGE